MSNLVKLSGVLVLIMMVVGCQNETLLKCQEENLALKEQLALSEKKLEDTKMVYDQMFDLIQAENEKLKSTDQENLKTAKELTEGELKETIRMLRQQLDERTKTLLLTQQELKKLQERIKELEKKIIG